MEYVTIEGEDKPVIMYEPYIYATVIDCSNHYTVFSNGKMKIIKKENKKNRR